MKTNPKNNSTHRIYNGASFCGSGSCCPVVDYHKDFQTVTISDPAKPENGKFAMTVKEYNTLLKNTKTV